jgi:hypothetical protein
VKGWELVVNLTPEFWLQTAVYLIGGACAVVAVAFRIGRMEARFATKSDLEKAQSEGNEKRARIYTRFDEYKTHLENNFVRRDMCGQMHISNKDELARIDKQYTDFRHEIRNQIQMLVDKFDELRRDLTERK